MQQTHEELTKKPLWGVFVWHEDPRYRAEDAIRVYRTEHGAGAHAEKLTAGLLGYPFSAAPRGFVARPIV